MKEFEEDVRAYFDQFDGEVLERLHAIRNMVYELVPDATEGIKYGIPTFLHFGNLIHYAAFKSHIGFYPVPSGIEAFKEALQPYKQGKGSIQFPLDAPLPLNLIRDIVQFRIAENEARAKQKR